MQRYTEKTPHSEALQAVEGYASAVSCRATDYAARWEVPPHSHAKHQLIYAIAGVMTVSTDTGHWVVPPSRGLWVPAGMTHAIRCLTLKLQRRIGFKKMKMRAHLNWPVTAIGYRQRRRLPPHVQLDIAVSDQHFSRNHVTSYGIG